MVKNCRAGAGVCYTSARSAILPSAPIVEQPARAWRVAYGTWNVATAVSALELPYATSV